MVATVKTKPQFAVGDRVRVLPIKPTDAHLWGKEGVVQGGQRTNGTLTVNLDGGKLRAFRPNELEVVTDETTQTPERTGGENTGDRPAETGTGNPSDRPSRRRKRPGGSQDLDEAGRPQPGESPPGTQGDDLVPGGVRLGDRVRGKHIKSGEPTEGIVTRIGRTILVLNNSRSAAIHKEGSEILQEQAISEDDDYLLQCVGLPWYEQTLAIENDQPTAIATKSPLDTLISEACNLYGQIEEAEEVAQSAAHSALAFAREMGDRLLNLKKDAGHGNWENVRSRIKSPRTGKELPSSTATLYQRIAARWAELESMEATSIRQAAELLKGDRKSTTVADLPLEPPPQTTQKDLGEAMDQVERSFSERKAAAINYGSNVAPETAEALASAGVMPCKPSISPEEFNREIWGTAPPGFRQTSCKTCTNQSLEDESGFRCEAGMFEAYGGVSRYEVTNCSKYTERTTVATQAVNEAPKGLSMLESIVWTWLSMHRYEANEDAVKDAAIAINEFLQTTFLEVNEDE